MKRSVLLAFILLLTMHVVAKERPIQEIRDIATQVLRMPDASTARAPMFSSTDLKVLRADKAITVMGLEGSGFVVVANDDAFQPVVGYSDGDFAVDCNENLAWYIDAVSKSMQSMLAEGRPRLTPHPTIPVVDPLLKTDWDQRAPFNSLCPHDEGGTHYPCGCVATALGQIMYYHQYPVQGNGYKEYYFRPSQGVGEQLTANFGETTYQWDKMLDHYQTGKYSEEEGQAVAEMILHIGVAVSMNYTPSGSGAYSSEARNGLIEYFRYNENIGLYFRDYYAIDAWMDLIYKELSKHRPIYYAGSDSHGTGGHAFVLDGFNDQGLVHVNWGWGSNGGNGFYDISLLNPSGYEFSVGQDMILGIADPANSSDVEYQSHLVSEYSFDVASISRVGSVTVINGVFVGQSIWNLCGYGWAGKLAVVMQNAEHTYVLQERTISNTPDRFNVLSNISDGGFKASIRIPADAADGIYRVFVASKDDRDTDWRLVHRSEGLINSYLVAISDGVASLVGSDASDVWTAIDDIHADVESTAPVCYFDLQGREVDASHRGLVIMRQGNTVKKVIR